MMSTRAIREFESSNNLPRCRIIALTGLASASARLEAMSSGVDYFMTKPMNFKALESLLRKGDEKRRKQSESHTSKEFGAVEEATLGTPTGRFENIREDSQRGSGRIEGPASDLNVEQTEHAPDDLQLNAEKAKERPHDPQSEHIQEDSERGVEGPEVPALGKSPKHPEHTEEDPERPYTEAQELAQIKQTEQSKHIHEDLQHRPRQVIEQPEAERTVQKEHIQEVPQQEAKEVKVMQMEQIEQIQHINEGSQQVTDNTEERLSVHEVRLRQDVDKVVSPEL
jgi:YesN/AraC family two-component response regulator